MSIDDATPEMWDKLRTKYKALAEEEYKVQGVGRGRAAVRDGERRVAD